MGPEGPVIGDPDHRDAANVRARGPGCPAPAPTLPRWVARHRHL